MIIIASEILYPGIRLIVSSSSSSSSFAKLNRSISSRYCLDSDYESIARRNLSRSMMEIGPVPKTTIMLTSGASGRINALFSIRAIRSLAMVVYAVLMLFLVPFSGRKRAISSSEKAVRNDGGGGGERRKSGGGSAVVVRVPKKIVTWRSTGEVDDVAARREIAMKRVVNDCGDDDGVDRRFELVVLGRGHTMFTQSWTPLKVSKIRGLIILLHGLNEHSSRYSDFARQLNSNGYKVYAMDWIGHGGSDGLHAYVHSLDVAVADMKSYLEKVLAENPGLPCFCFGHSTGAAIILKAVLDPKIEARVKGVVLTSPAVGIQPLHPVFGVLAPIFSFLLPKYQFSAANKTGVVVSRDPDALVAKYSDPLVFTGSIRLRTGYEILRITSYLQQNLTRVKVPFLVLHGAADRVTDPEASKKLYEESSSTDKTIKLYEGCLHDLLFEPEREEITREIINWLNCRTNI